MISHPAVIGTLSLFSLISTFTQASPLQPRDRSSRDLHPRQAADYKSNGCYTEATRGRALSGNAYFDNLMTVEKCAAACSGFTLFGLEYGRECFCGNTLNAGSVPAPPEQCSFKCPGNPDQKCGAGQRLNVYERVVTAPVVTNPAPSTYSAEGCYTEATTGRALSGKSFYDNAMTTAKCASACAGFDLFGLEYYRECYCGNRLQAGSVAAPSAECKYPCTGDKNEICGGDNRLNLYAFRTTPPVSTPKPYTFDGCFTEATRGRALTGSVFYDDAMTVEKCSSVCKGFTLFGLEYGRECYCGNTLQAGSQMTLESECNFPCPGNDAESCGAGNRLDVYHYEPATTTSSSSSTTSPSATATSSSSSTTSPSATSSSAASISSVMTNTETSTTSSAIETTTTSSLEPETTTTSIAAETTTTSSLEPETTTTSIAAETTTTSSLEPETITTSIAAETTTTSSLEPETTTTSIEPETTTTSIEAETTTTSIEPETTTTSIEAETTTTSIVEPEVTTTSSIEAEITTTSVELPITTSIEVPTISIETTTSSVEPETTTTSAEAGTTTTSSIELETTATSAEIPTTSIEVPTTIIEIPATSIVVPTTIIEIPSTSIELPTTTIGIPSTSIEVPTTIIEIPSTSIEIPTTILEPPTSTETTATSTLATTTSSVDTLTSSTSIDSTSSMTPSST
ncbi:MAG: hypothetical protein Q9208_004020, partial [Pyrenodesmia sp. 3 TL-2023]